MSSSNTIISVVGVSAPIVLAVGAGIWKLATTLASVSNQVGKELNHNGGGSLKDYAKSAADAAQMAAKEAEAARLEATKLKETLDALATAQGEYRVRVDQYRGEDVARLGQLQHDVTATRTGLALHVYEAQQVQALYAMQTGSPLLVPFSTPTGSPLPNGAETVVSVEDPMTKETP